MSKLHKEIHKKYLVDFKIDCPSFDIEKYAKYNLNKNCFNELCEANQFPFHIFHSRPHEMRPIYQCLKRNYEIEKGDLEFFSEPESIYVIVIKRLSEGLTCSNEWVAVGIFEVNDWSIQFAWVHPSVRENGIATTFLASYGVNVGPLLVSPPVSKSMIAALKKAVLIILKDPKSTELYYRNILEYLLEKIGDDRLTTLTQEELGKILQAYGNLTLYCGSGKIPDDESVKKKLFKAALDLLFYLRENPDAKESLSNEFEKAGFAQYHQQMIKTITKYGM